MSNTNEFGTTQSGIYPASEITDFRYRVTTAAIRDYMQDTLNKVVNAQMKEEIRLQEAGKVIRNPIQPIGIINCFMLLIKNNNNNPVDLPSFLILPSDKVMEDYSPLYNNNNRNNGNDELFGTDFYCTEEYHGNVRIRPSIYQLLNRFMFSNNRKAELQRSLYVKKKNDAEAYLRGNLRSVLNNENKISRDNAEILKIIRKPSRRFLTDNNRQIDYYIVALDTLMILRHMLRPIDRSVILDRVEVRVEDIETKTNNDYLLTCKRHIIPDQKNTIDMNNDFYKWFNAGRS